MNPSSDSTSNSDPCKCTTIAPHLRCPVHFPENTIETEAEAKQYPRSTFRAANETITCDKCGAWLVYSGFAARHFSTVVIPGTSLGGLIIDAHKASGCITATEADAAAHNCEVIR